MAGTAILFFGRSGGMSYSDDRDNAVLSGFARRVLDWLGGLSKLSRGIIIAVVAFSCIFILWTPTPPLNPVYSAAPFVWPEGCLPINYDINNSEISCSCKDEKNRIIRARERGISQSRGPDEWYRVGEDAISIYMSTGVVADSKCRRGGEIRSFFRTN
jgi:hypothetical protein